jgi:hypothetical protein
MQSAAKSNKRTREGKSVTEQKNDAEPMSGTKIQKNNKDVIVKSKTAKKRPAETMDSGAPVLDAKKKPKAPKTKKISLGQ